MIAVPAHRFLIVLPFLGALIYIIANGKDMTERRVRGAQVSQAHFDDYVRTMASSGGATGEIERAKGLLDSGAVTQQEFDALKAKALSSYERGRERVGEA